MYKDPTFNALDYSLSRRATGQQFEEGMRSFVRRFVQKENTSRTKMNIKDRIEVMKYSEDEDTKNGTDIMLVDTSGFFGHNGVIRLDVTHAFSKKDNMPFVRDSSEPLTVRGAHGYEYDLKYGIRVGNPKSNFEEPVIVVGFDMTPKEYRDFENDLDAQDDLAANIYEIMNSANDMLQSFYYQADEETRKRIDAEYDEDERPDISLLAPNTQYINEISRYAAPRWRLPPDTKLAQQSRKLFDEMAYAPVLKQLDRKYEDQFSSRVGDIEQDGKGQVL